jgi:hypothetical protein
MTIWIWRRKARAGGGSIAHLALALVVLLAAVRPSGAQEQQPVETFQLPYNHQPLALAYLAAPYAGGPTGPSAPDFSTGGASIVARFLPRAGLQPWEGIPFGLFKQTNLFYSGARVGVTGNVPGIGSGRPLDLRLYAFLPSELSVPSVRLLTYESDAWKRRPDAFSVLSDTTFVLIAPTRDGSGTDSIACVNKRSAPLGGRSLSCEEGTGEVIEDPLSGEPALLMRARRGPPQWLGAVPTEICIEDGRKLPSITIPYNGNLMPVRFSERKGQHLCTGGWLLDYLRVKESGIEIDGVRHRRLGSRSATPSGWKLLAAPPSKIGTSSIQRIVLAPPAPPSMVSAPAPLPAPVPVPVPSAPHPTLAVILNEWRWSLSIRKLWYGPLPAGRDAGQSFKCENGALSLGTAVWSKDKLIEADAVSVKTVWLPPGLRLEVTQPPSKLATLRQGIVFVAEGSAGNIYCGIATPLPGGGAEFQGKLEEEKVAPPPAPLPPVTTELVLQREGPAVVIVEKVSQGKVTKLANIDAASLTKTVEWSVGDKIRVRPADPEFQGFSAVKVDGATFKVPDDQSVEIPLTAQTRTIAIRTGFLLLKVPVVVATPNGAIEVVVGGGKTAFPKDAQPQRVLLKNVTLGEEVTIAPTGADQLMVGKLTVRGGGSPRTIQGATFKLERGDLQGGKDLRLDVELKSSALDLPAELLLKPVVHLGKRPLALASCKITLAGYPEGEFRHERDGRTRVKVSPGKRGRMGASYGIEVGGTAKVCTGFEGEALPAQKLAALAKGTELTVPVRRRGGRAFVGVLSWPLGGPDDEGNWRAALKALVETFDAGADEGRYLWGAIYAPDGKKLVASGETADYAPLDLNAFSPETIARFKAVRAALSYEDAVKRAVADVADLEGSVDLLVVAAGAEGACKWSNPFVSAATKGGRSALVRVVKAAPGQATDAASRARMCDVGAGKDDVGIAVEVAVDPAAVGGASDRLLREALEAAAKSLLTAPPPAPEAAPKAATEPPGDRKIASVAPAPDKSAAAETYQDRYELPDDYRALAVAYLAAPYTGSLMGPASTFRVGAERPGGSLLARFVKPADDGTRPWQGIPFGLFKGKTAQPDTRLSVTDSALGLGGSTALHPTLYLFVSEELRVVGLQKVMTFESDAGRKAGDVFSVLSDTSFVLRAYLEAPSIGIETIACINKGSLKDASAACEGNAGEVVEDPLSGGPALLMMGGKGLPKWLIAVPTEICVDGAAQGSIKTPPKVAVPTGSGQHKDVKLVRQGERWCTAVTDLSYPTVRDAGIRIGSEPLRKRLDSRRKSGAGAWSLRAAAPRKGPGGDWVQQLLLIPPG